MKTVLCVPGHDEAKVKKCRQYGADLILFDLEDSVPEGMKDRAREIVGPSITKSDAVRFNKPGADDLDWLRETCVLPSSVWLPKSDHWPIFDSYRSNRMRALATQYRIVVIVETPRLVSRLSYLLDEPRPDSYREGLAGLAFGAADFAAYMNVPASSPQVQYARQQVALAAVALGVPAYDSPYVDLRPDSYGRLRKNVNEALELGYQWKGVVHPAQIPVVQDVKYEPLFDKMFVNDYDKARGEEVVTVIGGHLIAPPMIRAARKRLEENK
jgi:citrate lyase beta subunit